MRCAVPGCQQAFHILCAAANGLEIAWKPNVCLAKDWDGPLMSPRVRVFCAVHSYNRRGVNVPNVMPEGSWLDPQTATWSDFAVVRWLPESPETCEEASVLPLGRLLSAGDKKDTEKAEAKGRAALERLIVAVDALHCQRQLQTDVSTKERLLLDVAEETRRNAPHVLVLE